jgi:hypothetical protein
MVKKGNTKIKKKVLFGVDVGVSRREKNRCLKRKGDMIFD